MKTHADRCFALYEDQVPCREIFDILYNKAYEQGHSFGDMEIENNLIDEVECFLSIVAIQKRK